MDYVEIINYFSVINETSLSCLLKEKEREALCDIISFGSGKKWFFVNQNKKNEK